MLTYRPITQKDNKAIAQVIRKSLEEYGVNQPVTVYTDPTTDDLYQLFQTPKSSYWIVTDNDIVIGGCGVFPTKGLPTGYAELVKLYISSAYRGKGIGKTLMMHCMNKAKALGYSRLYLESLPELSEAIGLYTSVGFKKLAHPLGESGHFACDLWMSCEL
jgi:putative acetyltransferase